MFSRTTATVALLAAVAAFSAACSDDRSGTRDRAPLTQPAPERFASGACRDAADPILALGRFTYTHEGAKTLGKAEYAELTAQGEKLIPVRERAEPAVADKISAVLTSIGYIRVRPGKSFDPALLRDLETARTQLQNACVTGT